MSNSGAVYQMVNKKTIFIEKFKGDFKDVNGGCTVNHTKSIQLIRNSDNLAVYIYLSSKPPEWKINVKEIVSHFTNMGRDKVYRCLNDLCMMRLLDRKERRNLGKFIEFQYFLYLEPLPNIQEVVEPFPDLPDTAEPLPENQETYKEKKLPYKEEKVKKGVNSSTSKPKPQAPSLEERQEHAHWSKKQDDKIPKDIKKIIKKVNDWNKYNAISCNATQPM